MAIPDVALSLDLGILITGIIAIGAYIERRQRRQSDQREQIRQMKHAIGTEIQLNQGLNKRELADYADHKQSELFGEKNKRAIQRNYYSDKLAHLPGDPVDKMKFNSLKRVESYNRDAYEAHRFDLYKLSEPVRNKITAYYAQLQRTSEIKQSLDQMDPNNQMRRARITTLFDNLLALWWNRIEALEAIQESEPEDYLLDPACLKPKDTEGEKEDSNESDAEPKGVEFQFSDNVPTAEVESDNT